MIQRSSQVAVHLTKNKTPYIRKFQEPIKNENRRSKQQNDSQQQQKMQNNNIPEGMLQRSSNSSEDYRLSNFQNYRENIDIQMVLIKEQTQEKKTRLVAREKSKSDYSGENFHPTNKLEKKDTVYSSLGVPVSLENIRKKTILEGRQAEEDCRLYKSGGWTRTKLMLTESRLALFEFSLEIKDLSKIKILPWINSSKTKSENIIKIAYKNQVQVFSVSIDKKNYEVPTSFYIFSRLVQKRLQTQNFQITNWEKEEHISKKVIQDSFIYGNIFKRSQMLGNWEKRYVVIKRNGIYSYRNSSQDEPHSFYINNESIKYMWTRFEKIESFLIIKIKHGLYKTQFGIPVSQFSLRTTNNWLYYFYRVIPTLDTINSEQK